MRITDGFNQTPVKFAPATVWLTIGVSEHHPTREGFYHSITNCHALLLAPAQVSAAVLIFRVLTYHFYGTLAISGPRGGGDEGTRHQLENIFTPA